MQKICAIYITFILFCSYGIAQQTPLYSQYILNEFVINPSVAGIDGMTSINLTGRRQWLGWEFAPRTYSASVSTRVLKSPQPFLGSKKVGTKLRKSPSGKVGLGASLLSDRNGAIVRTGINLTYAYHLMIEQSQLSFGLSFLVQQFKIDQSLAALDLRSSDPLQGVIGKSSYIPDAAFGINYSANKINTGISIFQIFQSPVKYNGREVYFRELKQVRHYYFTGTYKEQFLDKKDWEYEPSVIIRGTENLQGSADISVRFIYKRQYWAGLSVRTSGDFVLLMGTKLDKFYFGYSFDYGLSEISRSSYGSHEALMAIKLGDSKRRYRYWERY